MPSNWVYLAVGAGGIVLALKGFGVWPVSFWLSSAFIGVVCLVQGLLKTDLYKDKADTLGPGWTRTDERYFDTASGQMMEVRFNTTTGERRSVPVRP